MSLGDQGLRSRVYDKSNQLFANPPFPALLYGKTSRLAQRTCDSGRSGHILRLRRGTHPHLLAALIADGVDAVAMDVKSIPDLEHYARVTPGITPAQVDAVRRSIDLLRRSGIEYPLRMTLIPGVHTQHIKNLLDTSFSGDPYACHAFRDPGSDDVVADHTVIAPVNTPKLS